MFAIVTGLAVVASLLPGDGHAAGRWGLVIGNSSYPGDPLPRSVVDARLIGDELQRAQFAVTHVRNASRSAMLQALQALANQAGNGGDLVFYFAGYAIHVAGGDYLVPIDVTPDSTSALMRESVGLAELLGVIADAKPRFALVIVDACRNNPLASRHGAIVDISQQSPPPSAGTGQIVVLPSEKGQYCLEETPDRGRDRGAANGVFAQELATQMRRPATPVREVLEATQAAVAARAGSARHSQRPVVVDRSTGDFAFHPTARAETLATPARTRGPGERTLEDVEDDVWRSVSAARTADAYAAYLREYPAGRYAPAARVQREILAGSAASSDPRRLAGKRFVATNGRYTLDIVFQQDGARIRRFTGPSVGALSGDGGGSSGSAAVTIQCGLGNWLRLGDEAELSARCNYDDASQTPISVWGTFPRLTIEQYGRPGGEELVLIEVR